MMQHELAHCFDAREWAKEFMKMHNNPNIEIDEGLMLAWFGNALMAGYLHKEQGGVA